MFTEKQKIRAIELFCRDKTESRWPASCCLLVTRQASLFKKQACRTIILYIQTDPYREPDRGCHDMGTSRMTIHTRVVLSAQPARYHCDDCPSVSVPVPGGLVLCH